MNNNLIAGIDIGGTKTHVLVSRDGQIIADDITPTEDWRTWDSAKDAEGLAALVKRVAGGEDVAASAFGAHGCDTDEQCRQLQADLSARMKGVVRVVNDSELLVPAAGYFSGVGVVSGTGSIAVARGRNGEMLAAGGWGWILGDEGSAPALVREAARAVRGSIDAGNLSDPLIDALMNVLDTKEATKLGRLLNENRSAVVWGRYAGAVFSAADAGSPLAAKVIQDGGRALGALVEVLIGRGADASRVVAGGGVIVEQPRLMDAFRASMADVSPTSEVILLREPPVKGALALAAQLLDQTAQGALRA